MVKTCNFCDNCIDSLIRDRIVLGVREKEARSALLKKRELTLKDAIDICKAEENAVRESKIYLKDDPYQSQSVSAVKPQNKIGRKWNAVERDCKYCGRRHAMKKEFLLGVKRAPNVLVKITLQSNVVLNYFTETLNR